MTTTNLPTSNATPNPAPTYLGASSVPPTNPAPTSTISDTPPTVSPLGSHPQSGRDLTSDLTVEMETANPETSG
jgi:hypothetical protein